MHCGQTGLMSDSCETGTLVLVGISGLPVQQCVNGREEDAAGCLECQFTTFHWVAMFPKPLAHSCLLCSLQACEDPNFQWHRCKSEERKWQGQVGGGRGL